VRRAAALALAVVLAGATPGAAVERHLLGALELAGYPPGTTPPAFESRTVEGRAVTLTGLRGTVVLLTFWATWCAPCREELPALEQLHREQGSHGLSIVGVNVRESADAVGRYGRELGLTFPLLLDPEGEIQRVYGVIGLPTVFVVARDGRAVARGIGPRDWRSAPAGALLRALLDEGVPPRRGR
jgi:thiol-disulfide isomerase/thioredoxin